MSPLLPLYYRLFVLPYHLLSFTSSSFLSSSISPIFTPSHASLFSYYSFSSFLVSSSLPFICTLLLAAMFTLFNLPSLWFPPSSQDLTILRFFVITPTPSTLPSLLQVLPAAFSSTPIVIFHCHLHILYPFFAPPFLSPSLKAPSTPSLFQPLLSSHLHLQNPSLSFPRRAILCDSRGDKTYRSTIS